MIYDSDREVLRMKLAFFFHWFLFFQGKYSSKSILKIVMRVPISETLTHFRVYYLINFYLENYWSINTNRAIRSSIRFPYITIIVMIQFIQWISRIYERNVLDFTIIWRIFRFRLTDIGFAINLPNGLFIGTKCIWTFLLCR